MRVADTVSAGAAPAAGGEPSAGARERVEDWVRALSKAVRTYQLYEGSGPALDRFLASLDTKLDALWTELPLLQLEVEEHQIRWSNETVFLPTERSDDLPFLLFRDGIRELTFLPGLDHDELLSFVSVLAGANRIRSEDDDLLTLLWELELPNLRYRYVDLLAEGVELPKGGADAAPVEQGAVRSDVAEPPRSALSPDDFQESLYFLDEVELAQLARELSKEHQRDLWADIIAALFDRLEDGTAERQTRIVAIVADLLPTLLGAGNLRKGAVLLAEIAMLLQPDSPLPAALRQETESIFQRLAAPDVIAELVRSTDVNSSSVSAADLSEFLAHLPAAALAPLMRGERDASRPEIRRSIAAAIERLAAAHPHRVVELLHEDEPVLLAGAARWIGRLQIASAAPAVVRLLDHADAEIRLVAIEALQSLRNSTAAEAVTRALEDPEQGVRVAAARAIAEMRYPAALAVLEKTVTSSRLRDAELTERIAFFEAFGSLAGADGVKLLDRLLNGKSWIGRREPAEIRACAALGLGRVRTPDARSALTRAADETDPVVRSAVTRAIRAVTT